MGPTLLAFFRHWLYRKKEFLLPKTPEKGLKALKVWGKIEKKLKGKCGIRTLNLLSGNLQSYPLDHRELLQIAGII